MIDVEKLIAAGRQLNAVIPIEGGEPVSLIPNGYQLAGLARFLPPRFIKQDVELDDADSFIAYVNRFKGAGTIIFAKISESGAGFHAALDYHENPTQRAEPARVAHTAEFVCRPTVEWKAWMQQDRLDMNQEQFACFLEEHSRLFRAPTGAELLELITTLEGKSHVNFTSGVRLQNGASKLTFENDVALMGGVGTGQIEIPQTFRVALSPFEGEAPYEVTARLRYRIASRKLSFFYQTIEPHLIVRDAARHIVHRVEEGTDVTVLMGMMDPPCK